MPIHQELMDEVTKRGRWEQSTYGLSEREYQAWRAQYHSAKRRSIPFRFTLLGWCLWWRGQLRGLGQSARRGRGRDCYVMARIGDRGAYEPDNVRCIHPGDNIREIPEDVRAIMVERTTATRKANGHPRGAHLKVRGDGHPKSHAVLTPIGRFGSIALAAEAAGITRAGGLHRVRRGVWQLADV